ncbi:glycoside hydrolase family 43 protein [Ectobacillus funiculus]|uniref:glycoside hydrolase family 43 protein n=1 Tax=Ectobacillus funiculus TaxID=137993 RepID=UPI00397CBF7A
MIQNPILPGCNPDPYFLRVEDDYYIATSTFEWFPGVQIHHSKDLVHWQLLTHPLTHVSQLDLRGTPSSGGVWAPNLTYKDGVFYLVYTDVKNRTGVYKDTHNYLVNATDIMGPWSEPIYLNSSGFDPSLFHDSDGRKWLLNMRWNFRKGYKRFDGILIQEYSVEKQSLIGSARVILEGADWVIEGPNLYKKGEYYYLMLAEGGTGYNHSVTVARSRNILGPYERDPDNPILTTRNDPDHPLQKAGHGSIVETQNGDWYMAYLCARPLKSRKLCPLGRETALQRCDWTEDGWLRLEGGSHLPKIIVEGPSLPPYPFKEPKEKENFDEEKLGIHFNTLRVPADDSWLSLKERPGYLRIKGRESLTSLNEQSMVARRIQHYLCNIETCIEFDPEHYMQMAGLICLYDENDYFYLRISHDERLGKHLGIVTSKQGKYDELDNDFISIEDWDRCYLRATVREEVIQFYYSKDAIEWNVIGPILDFGQLSDEYEGKLGFTGAFAGMCVQDLSGQRKHADFDYFEYKIIDAVL